MKEQPDNQLSPQELLERDQKLLEALCIDYTAVYYCNLAKNTMEPIKRSVHYTTFSGGTTVERFKRYLETDLLPHLNGNSILVMDNMKSHHAKAVKELLDSSGVRYIYLPPYSPDLNPFETMVEGKGSFAQIQSKDAGCSSKCDSERFSLCYCF